MPITKQTYTVSAIWTPSQVANIFRSAFIDAGLMTEWYDAFTSSSTVNRVMEVTYASNKVFGKCYYWFQFSTSRIVFHITTGWNATTHVPTGVQFLDYYYSDTSSLSYGRDIGSVSTGVKVDVVRYTSQINSTHSVFTVGQSSVLRTFIIAHPSHQVASWIDLDKVLFNHFVIVEGYQSSRNGAIYFNSAYNLCRSYGIGSAFGDGSWHPDSSVCTASYTAAGRAATSSSQNFPLGTSPSGTQTDFSLLLPNATSALNPAYSANYNPVVTGLPYSFYMSNSQMPADLGIVVTYANNTLDSYDRFVVSPGVEEWEIIARSNSSSASIGASMALAARVV